MDTHLPLDRDGPHMNHKKLRRLYGEERLQVRRRGVRRRTLTLLSNAQFNWLVDFGQNYQEHDDCERDYTAPSVHFSTRSEVLRITYGPERI